VTLTERLAPVSIGLAAGAMAVGYALEGLWVGTLVSAVMGAAWLAGHWRRWGWITSVALPLSAGAAAIGLWLDVGSGWMLAGLVAALTAWDLEHFVQSLRSVDRVDHARELERSHLRRLLVVDGLGMALAALALRIRVRIGFGIMALLSLLLILALSRVVRYVRHEAN
jgi:hypothetical protein